MCAALFASEYLEGRSNENLKLLQETINEFMFKTHHGWSDILRIYRIILLTYISNRKMDSISKPMFDPKGKELFFFLHIVTYAYLFSDLCMIHRHILDAM